MSGAPTRVLVVDDDAGGRYLKAHILRKNGYDVAEAASGGAAIVECEASVPDLALVDMRLPDIHGVEVCKRLKAHFSGIAILQTSAAITSALDRAHALEGGADAFLVEPIEPEELLATVKALLRMRGAEQALRQVNETLENLVDARTHELTESNRRLEVEMAERRKAEDVLWHTQKLEAVGELTGGIAHDFNNLLGVIVLSSEMIRAEFERGRAPSRAKVLRLLTASEIATDRATKLTRQLLAFARHSTLQLGVVTLDEVIVGCDLFLRRALGETISLTVQFGKDLWPCRIDAAQFESAMLNLVVNARDAMPAGGQLEISTSNVIIDVAEALRLGELTAGSYVLIKVTDTGTGMEPEVAARAFEPFFTTKEVGKGTGLGLSQVYGFIKQSGGHVRIETKLGEGTTFCLYLPRCDPVEAPARDQGETAPTPPTGSETVLVVEDNAAVLELAVNSISELGYRVITAVDGPSALDILRSEQPIDLLFSDVVMPGGMNGFELIDKARAMRGELKALATSGYANTHRPEAERPDVPLLLKPYHHGDLAKCIRMALDQG